MSNTTLTPTVGAVALAGVAALFSPLTIQPTSNGPEVQGRQQTFTWSGLSAGSVGAATPNLSWRRASFQVSGVFGSGGTLQLQGSNDGSTWNNLTPSALNSAGFVGALGTMEAPKFIRPEVPGGDGTTLLNVTGWLS